MHTREQAPGAIPNGRKVIKIASERGDTHPVGSVATVLGSLRHPDLGFAYFVEWGGHPNMASLVVGTKIRPIG
jgi:hypothetical protein